MHASPRRTVGFLIRWTGRSFIISNDLDSVCPHVCEYLPVLFCMLRGGLLRAALYALWWSISAEFSTVYSGKWTNPNMSALLSTIVGVLFAPGSCECIHNNQCICEAAPLHNKCNTIIKYQENTRVNDSSTGKMVNGMLGSIDKIS